MSDEGSCSFCNCAAIVARVAEALPGTQVKRLAFPDAPERREGGEPRAQAEAGLPGRTHFR